MSTQIQLRHDTAANWTSVNPTLAIGEFGVETDTGLLKIGNGSSAWSSLGYTYLLPSQSTHNGQYLTTNGSTPSWATVDALPSQATHGGQYLTTNGSTASWASVTTDPNPNIFMMMGA